MVIWVTLKSPASMRSTSVSEDARCENLFLMGPILLRELAPVAQMPGKTLAVWLLIRHRSDLGRGDWITLPRTLLDEWGIRKDARAEALRRLEDAGLILVERPKGYMLKVKLISRR